MDMYIYIYKIYTHIYILSGGDTPWLRVYVFNIHMCVIYVYKNRVDYVHHDKKHIYTHLSLYMYIYIYIHMYTQIGE